MQAVNLRSFRQKVRSHKKGLRAFLTRLEKKPPRNLDHLTIQVDKAVWRETNCLSCANCCKTMSPTYTPADINGSPLILNDDRPFGKWLYFDAKTATGEQATPCQFLDLTTNMCSIYAVRP